MTVDEFFAEYLPLSFLMRIVLQVISIELDSVFGLKGSKFIVMHFLFGFLRDDLISFAVTWFLWSVVSSSYVTTSTNIKFNLISCLFL